MKKLSESARQILNDPRRIACRDEWFARMEHLSTGEYDPYNAQYVYTLGGIMASSSLSNPHTHPEDWMIECLEQLAACPPNPDSRFVPLCVCPWLYGVHFIDRMFGADVFFKDDQWNARYLTTPIGQLQMPDLERDETWSLARRAAQTFLEADVKLPLYSTPVLSSALNIFINLYGQEGLIAMLEEEEAAAHDLKVINDLICTLHQWHRENIPHAQLQGTCCDGRTQPPGSGQLCGCSCHLLSGPLYKDMIAPLDDALLSLYPKGGMIHLCGAHAQHIPVFREMQHLRAVQLNDRAAADLEMYLQGLRRDQVVYVNPCPEMPLDRILSISGGDRVICVCRIDAPQRP